MNLSVTYYSTFGIILINFAIILCPLFVRRGLFPFTLFVNQYFSPVMVDIDSQNM